MPREAFGRNHRFLGRERLLTFEEIARLARIFVSLGVRKVRLTGGEPLLRRGIEDLVEMLACIPGLDLTLTTNGSLLAGKARALVAAGLRRATVSLDAMDDRSFRAMNGGCCSADRVLSGIEAASRAGMTPVKVNVVVKRGVNEGSILPIARHFRGKGQIVRFIEYMDVGGSNGWRLDEVVSASEILAMITAELPLEPVAPNSVGEVATRWRYRDGAGEIGIIASVTQPFCQDCNRVRLSADGQLYTCLFARAGYDLRGLLRSGAGDDVLSEAISRTWSTREDRYSEIRSERTRDLPRVDMSYIGG